MTEPGAVFNGGGRRADGCLLGSGALFSGSEVLGSNRILCHLGGKGVGGEAIPSCELVRRTGRPLVVRESLMVQDFVKPTLLIFFGVEAVPKRRSSAVKGDFKQGLSLTGRLGTTDGGDDCELGVTRATALPGIGLAEGERLLRLALEEMLGDFNL